MPKTREVKVKELSELPLYMTINDTVDLLGFGDTVVRQWFKTRDFPKICAGVEKVNKYDLLEWIDKRYGNPRANFTNKCNSVSELVDEVKELVDVFKNRMEVG